MGLFSTLFGSGVQKELEELKQNIVNQSTKITKLEQQLEESNAAYVSRVEAYELLQHTADELKAKVEEHDDYTDELEEDNRKLLMQVKVYETQIEQIEDELSRTLKDLNDKINSNEINENSNCKTCRNPIEVNRLTRLNNDLNDRVAQARAERDTYKQQVRELEKYIAELEGKTIIEEPPELPKPPENTDAEPSDLVLNEGFRKITLNKEQARAYHDIINNCDNFFVTGEAGTGKSVLLRYLRDNYPDGGVAVAAPTGIAAVNVNGVTLHSLFGLRMGAHDPRKDGAASDKVANVLRNLNLLIIDEISMVRSDTMDTIDKKLRHARQNDKPFGGLKLVVFGDLYQLPPVVSSGQEHNYLDANYCSEYFFDCPIIHTHPFKRINLTVNNRQGSDKAWAEVLNKVRRGCNDEHIMDTINSVRGNVIDDNWEGIRLCSRSKPAEDYNEFMLSKLPGKEYTYTGIVTGDFEKTKKPVPEVLRLKNGARVMFCRNDNENNMYSNGTMGTVVALGEDFIDIKITDKNSPFKDEVVNLRTNTWDNYIMSYDPAKKSISQFSIGRFTQYPIKPAYAITIHKSQGQTYDCNVCVDYSNGHAFAAGQTYVALSRITRLENLYLTDSIRQSDIYCDSIVTDYLDGKINTAYNINGKVKKAYKNYVEIEPPKNPKKITGTKVGSIMGVNPHMTQFETWCEICNFASKSSKNGKGNKSENKQEEGNKFERAGRIIEPKVIEFCRAKLNGPFVKVVSPEDMFGKDAANSQHFDFFKNIKTFGGMWDAKINNKSNDVAVIEIKTTSMSNLSKWYGREGNEKNIPEYYKMQAALYAYLMGVDTFYFATAHLESSAWNNPNGFVCTNENTIITKFSMQEDFPNFSTEIYRFCEEWYKKYVLTGRSPEKDEVRDEILWNEIVKNVKIEEPKKKTFGSFTDLLKELESKEVDEDELLGDW